MIIESSSTLARNNGIKMLCYGDSGIGKTMLVATLPKPILISTEAGELSLSPKNIAAVFGADKPGISYDIDVIRVATMTDLAEAFDFVSSSADAAKYDSIALDSISEISDVIFQSESAGIKDKRPAYIEAMAKMVECVKKFRDIQGKHVYMSSRIALSKDDVLGNTAYVPESFSGKMSYKMPYFLDILLCYRLVEMKDKSGNDILVRRLQTALDDQYKCKDRSGCLLKFERPNLGQLINKILNGS